jgi:hypothetical protein
MPALLLRSALRWKPTARYLDDPWGCFTDFVSILEGRGANFVTFRDAINGEIDDGAINVILDHHIDASPLETEIMCRWEREAGIRSSVYLFSECTSCRAVEGSGTYTLDDLDLDLYRAIERDGFEIGYHQNAVGRAREEIEGRLVGQEVSDAVRVRARELFGEDVAALRRHFTVSTFIPHGGGQGNPLLRDVPETCADLVWTYNNAASSPLGDRRPRYSNWTDSKSRALDPQVITGYGAQYVCRHDNLGTKALLAGPGLHHVLIHAGRFADGMPYELAGRDYADRPVMRGSDFMQEVELPLTLPGVAGPRWGGADRASATLAADEDVLLPADPPEDYRLLTDCPRVLGAHLLTHPRCLGYLAYPGKLDRERAGIARKPEPDKIRGARHPKLPVAEALPARAEDAFTTDAVDESVRPFFNEIHTLRLFAHLRDAPITFDVIALRRWPVARQSELLALHEVLRRYVSMSAEIHVCLRATEEVRCRPEWRRLSAMAGVLDRFRVTTEVDRRTGEGLIEICRGRTSLLRRMRQKLRI